MSEVGGLVHLRIAGAKATVVSFTLRITSVSLYPSFPSVQMLVRICFFGFLCASNKLGCDPAAPKHKKKG
jgi:hypothetical protein